MKIPSRETVERLREQYPIGCRVVLDKMDDVQAPRLEPREPSVALTISGASWSIGTTEAP